MDDISKRMIKLVGNSVKTETGIVPDWVTWKS